MATVNARERYATKEARATPHNSSCKRVQRINLTDRGGQYQ